jgi:hypothetical protein
MRLNGLTLLMATPHHKAWKPSAVLMLPDARMLPGSDILDTVCTFQLVEENF